MHSGDYFTRLGATLTAGLLLGLAMIKPNAGERAVGKLSNLAPEPAPIAEKTCSTTRAALSGPFAPLEDVLSVSPLGSVTAPGEPLPAPYIRINMRKGTGAFDRRQTNALAPARVEITAIERHSETTPSGKKQGTWTVHMSVCESITLTYDRLDSISPMLLHRVGGMAVFQEMGKPEHLAVRTRVRLQKGDIIGRSDGFDIALHDASLTPKTLARPERYRQNPYQQARAIGANPQLQEAITTDITRAQCPINYLDEPGRIAWNAKLGDAYGMRKSKGEEACRTALIDFKGTAQGVWFTDSSHNAVTDKVSAIALAPDTIDQKRQIFALHGRVRSISPDMVGLSPALQDAREKAAKDFLTFEQEDGRINAPFALVTDNGPYCYQDLRANFVGPRIGGVLLLEISKDSSGADLMRLEARSDYNSCIDMPRPWSFTGKETTFYR